ncbi:MAG TPA: S9 family peptidase [Phycisphaerae bacterium]|nr:S9 family peptidase [Phycisphaerae bacterium]HNU46799.1 S9 family peptidase [Phycisphaerae bacterium]
MRWWRTGVAVWAVWVVVRGPAVAAEPARTHDIEAEDYFSLGVIAECALAPDGRHIAYTEVRWGGADEKRTSDLWVVEVATQTRTRLTFERVGATAPTWSPDGRYIYFTGKYKRAGEEKPPWNGKVQVWRVSAAGGEPLAMTRVSDGVGQFELSRDGRKLLYTKSVQHFDDDAFKALREKHDDLEYGHGLTELSEVWALDVEGWTEKKVVDEKRVVREMKLSPDGKRLAMITTADDQLITHEGWSRLDVYDLETQKATELTGPDWRKDHPTPYGWLEGPAWADDGQALAVGVYYDGYPSELYLAEENGGQWTLRKLARPAGVMVSDFGVCQWWPGSRDLCFVGEERGRTRVYCLPELRGGGQGKTRVLTPGDFVVHAFDLPDRPGPLAIIRSSTTETGDIYLAQESGVLQRVTKINPQMDTWKLPQISIVSWKGAQGDAVEGILELPPEYKPGDGPLPMVVELHGGPTDATRYHMQFWIYGRTTLPAKGYALLSPNYRGSTGYGDEFLTDLVGHENNIEIEDILTGVDAMVERGVADPQRVGVIGWSNGGLLVNCILTHTDRFHAASSGAGIVDMVLQWGSEDTPGHVINYMQGLPWEAPEAYRKASAIFALDKITTPTLIHVGGADERCPPAHSKALYRALHRYLKVPAELVVYPDEGHGLLVRKNRLAKMEWDLAWFERYLLNKADETGAP